MRIINNIINLILEQHKGEEYPKVELKFRELESRIHLSIHHINNSYNKTIKNTIDRLGSTYTHIIKNQINGMCNLYLKADFGIDGYAEINLWNGQERTPKKIDNFIGGVEHIFEFCKE